MESYGSNNCMYAHLYVQFVAWLAFFGLFIMRANQPTGYNVGIFIGCVLARIVEGKKYDPKAPNQTLVQVLSNTLFELVIAYLTVHLLVLLKNLMVIVMIPLQNLNWETNLDKLRYFARFSVVVGWAVFYIYVYFYVY